MFILVAAFALFLLTNIETEASVVKNENVELEYWIPMTKMWYTTPPVPYQGPYIYMRTSLNGNCMDGYIGAVNLTSGYFRYEGWLYPCGGTKPIPTKKPIEVEILREEESY